MNTNKPQTWDDEQPWYEDEPKTADRLPEGAGRWYEKEPHKPKKPRKLGLSPAEMIEQAHNAPPALIEGLLPSEAVVTFAGEPGTGKSFTALSWACAVATGTDWHDRKVSQAHPVVYVMGEGYRDFGNRVEAWQTVHGQELPETLRLVDGHRDGLTLTEEGLGWVDDLAAMEVGLIIFDTFAMLSEVDNENDNSQVGQVIQIAHQFSRRTGATVVIVHHTSKDGHVRGATSFRGNVDTVAISKEESSGDGFFLSTEGKDKGKQRDMVPTVVHGLKIVSPGVIAMDKQAAQKKEQRDGAIADLFKIMKPQQDVDAQDD